MSKKRRVGWIFRTEHEPRRIIAYATGPDGTVSQHAFANNTEGTRGAVNWMTATLERDDWLLENMDFLGYRIYVEVNDSFDSQELHDSDSCPECKRAYSDERGHTENCQTGVAILKRMQRR